VVFIIDAGIPWGTPSTAYDAIYTASGGTWPNLASYFNTVNTYFPATYFAMVYFANTGDSRVPNWVDRIYKASGIATPGSTSNPQTVLTVDFCRYNQNGGAVGSASFGVLDHELGHAWAARVFYGSTPGPTALSDGHWAENSTIDCQMSRVYSDDGGLSDLVVQGNPTTGFHFQRVDRTRHNNTQHLSEAALYLAGLRAEWPTTYLLNNPVYHPDGTMGSSSVSTFDHQALVDAQGVRTPDYTTAMKRFKLGFVYIARDANEVNTVYQAVESSAAQFCESETIDPVNYTSQIPFLCDTLFRGSVDGRLADLDGNPTPTLALANDHVVSSDGTASVGFTAGVASGPAPVVTVVPASSCASISGGSVQFTGLPDGVHFFTLKAQTPAGKKTFAHLVVEVARPAGNVTVTASAQDQVVTALTAASFTVTASTSGTGPLAYQWYRVANGTSTASPVMDAAGVYSGAATSTLTVTTSTAMNGDQFYCLVSDGVDSATSNFHADTILRVDPNNASATATLLNTTPAILTVNETLPVISAQPADTTATAGNATSFTVATSGAPATFGYEHYQWQRLPAGSATWADLANAGAYTTVTFPTLHLVTSAGMSGDQFRCVISNTAGSVTSNAAALIVGTRPSITAQGATVPAAGGGTTTLSALTLPLILNLFTGDAVTLSVTAAGTGPFTYTWKKYGVAVPNSDSPALTLPSLGAGDAGSYSVTIDSAYGTTGSPAVISVGTPSSPPSFSVQPAAKSTAAGGSVTFTATLASTTGLPVDYQWNLNGSPLPGASGTSATRTLTYSPSGVGLADAGNYTVTATNTGGYVINAFNTVYTGTRAVTSSAAALTVTNVPQAITFAALPDVLFSFTPLALAATADSGLPVTFSLLAGNASLNGTSLTLGGTGAVTVRASQTGNATFAAAANVDRTFNVLASFDSWRLAGFTTAELNDPLVGGPNSIAGHDGLTNLVKYALGLAPKADAVSGLTTLTTDGTNWIYTFTRPTAATDVTCSVQVSADLVNWTAAGVNLQLVGSANGTDTWQATYPVASAPNAFFRLQVTNP
jgi:hypothetical protein